MSNQAGWEKASGYGIAAVAVAIIIGIGLFFTGVIAPIEISELPDPQTQAEPQAEAGADTVPETPAGQITENAADVIPEDPADEVSDPTENAANVADAPETGDEPEIADGGAALPSPPAIDVFRLETDGGMLVAGQTQPGWETQILVDGTAVATVTQDSSGQFAEFLNLDYSDQPRVLSLLMRAPDGQVELASNDEIILAPTQKPALTAAVDAPETEPETEGDDMALAQSDPPEGAATQEQSGSQAVLLADESGVQVLQPPEPADKSPEVMSTVALDAITYSDAGQVQLAGRAMGAGSVRVYLDNAPIITSNIAEDGNWRSELPQVDTGVYTLRIDELDDEGRVTSRVETPFKREDEEVLAQAGANQASSKVRAVTVQPGSTLWAISREAYGEGTLYVRVFEANRARIRDPDLIYPGQVFTIPE